MKRGSNSFRAFRPGRCFAAFAGVWCRRAAAIRSDGQKRARITSMNAGKPIVCFLFFLSSLAASAQLYTQIGTDPTFQQLVDSGVIVPGVSSSPGPVNGSTIDVNNTLLEQQTGVTGPMSKRHPDPHPGQLLGPAVELPQLHPLVSGGRQRPGDAPVPRRAERAQRDWRRTARRAASRPFSAVRRESGTWSVWEGTYTIIEPLQSNIFQLFHEGGQLWAFHLRMTNTGTITFNRRAPSPGCRPTSPSPPTWWASPSASASAPTARATRCIKRSPS
jgi:hypothetical protein